MRQASLKAVFKLAKKDKKIVFIGSDLGPGILEEMKQKYPERFFMEGVTEQGIIGMAAGLALEGYQLPQAVRCHSHSFSFCDFPR